MSDDTDFTKPWRVVGNSWQYTTVYSADTPICRLDLEDWGVTEDNQSELEAKQAKVAKLIAAAPALLEKSIALREAQRAYMADRGNDLLGMKVAEAAQELDFVIALAEQEGK